MIKNVLKKIAAILPFFMKRPVEVFKLFIIKPALFINTNTKSTFYSKKITIVSFPRSGSSWVGSILGFGDDVLYLREPVTTSYMLDSPNRVSVFESSMCQDWRRYQIYINRALDGEPQRLNAIYKYPKQCHNTPVKNKKLIIKEINPLVIQEYLTKVDSIVYLVRHPYSVAQSYIALNWHTTDLFTNRVSKASLKLVLNNYPDLLQTNFFTQMGYLLGWLEAKTKYLLDKRNFLIRYEDICQDPYNQYQMLFNQLELSFTNDVKQQLNMSLSGVSQTEKGQYSLQRNQQDVALVKVNKSNKQEYIDLMDAYLLAVTHHNQHYSTAIKAAYEIQSPLIKWIE